MWQLMVGHLRNVEVKVSPHASPITATYDFIGKDGPIPEGTEVILGCSTKGGDCERFREAPKYVKDGVMLRDMRAAAVRPSQHSAQYMGLLNVSPLKEDMPSVKDPGKDPREFHASDMRYLLGKAEEDEEAIELLEDFVGEDKIFDLLSIFDIDSGMNELSGMAGGAVAGGGGRKKRRNTLIRQENIDLTIVDDVIRLIMERGIMQ